MRSIIFDTNINDDRCPWVVDRDCRAVFFSTISAGGIFTKDPELTYLDLYQNIPRPPTSYECWRLYTSTEHVGGNFSLPMKKGETIYFTSYIRQQQNTSVQLIVEDDLQPEDT